MDMRHQYDAALKATNTWLEVARPEIQGKAVIRPIQVRGRDLITLLPSKNMYTTHPLSKDRQAWDADWFGQYE
jgi:hypothetical protein